MIPFELPQETGVRPIYFTLLLGLLGVTACLHLVVLVANWSGYWRGNMYWSQPPERIRVNLDDYELSVPAGLLQGPAHRLSQLTGDLHLSRLKMTALWPSMRGVTSDLRHDAKKVLYLDISIGKPAETMNDQLQSVFLKLARGKPEAGPGGLTRLRLAAEDTLEQDDIYYEAGRQRGFIARCTSTPTNGANCYREMNWGPLLITYRFDPSLLSNWGSLERRVRTLIMDLTP